MKKDMILIDNHGGKGKALPSFGKCFSKARRLLCLGALVAGLGMTACSDDEEVIPAGLTPTTESEAYFTEGMAFPAEGGDIKLTFTVNEAWTATIVTETTQNWCFLSANDGEAGDVELTVSVTRNEALYRKAVITLVAGSLERTVTVKQSGSEVVTLNVETAGTLPELIGEESKYTITDLTLSGELNGTDILFLREMAGAGRTDEDVDTTRILQKLNLTNVRIIEGGDYYYDLYDYYHCYTINDVITDYMFYNCHSLIAIDLPEGVTSIGQGAFYRCSSLTAINLPEGIKSIGTGAFNGCSSLTAIDLPEGIKSIGNSAFACCSSLTAIDLPEGFKSIGNSAFDGCSSLTYINLPEGITSIGEWAFDGCSSLTAIDLPESVTSIGDHAFSGCRNLTTINLPKGITSIGNATFFGCSSLTAINLPEGITNIGNSAFCNCSNLTTINLPKGITSIGESTFSSCRNLTIIDLPEGITSIEQWTFYGCSRLTSIDLPEGITSIGERAFCNCSSLKDMHLRASIPPDVESDIFNYSSNCTLHIPKGSLAAYRQSPDWDEVWSQFKEIIEE